jgi:hypothetical protein
MSLPFGVTPADPLSFAASLGVLAKVAVLASYIPAHRATKIDPVDALLRMSGADDGAGIRRATEFRCAGAPSRQRQRLSVSDLERSRVLLNYGVRCDQLPCLQFRRDEDGCHRDLLSTLFRLFPPIPLGVMLPAIASERKTNDVSRASHMRAEPFPKLAPAREGGS